MNSTADMYDVNETNEGYDFTSKKHLNHSSFQHKNNKKQIIMMIVISLLMIGTGISLYALQQNQEVRSKAATVSKPICESWTNVDINGCNDYWEKYECWNQKNPDGTQLKNCPTRTTDPICKTKTKNIELNINTSNADKIFIQDEPDYDRGTDSFWCKDVKKWDTQWTKEMKTDIPTKVYRQLWDTQPGPHKICIKLENAAGSVQCGGIIDYEKPTDKPYCMSWGNTYINSCNVYLDFLNEKPACITTSRKVTINTALFAETIAETDNIRIKEVDPDTECINVDFSGKYIPFTKKTTFELTSSPGAKKVCVEYTNGAGSSKCGGIIHYKPITSTNTPTPKPTNTPTSKPTNTPTSKPTNTPTSKPTNTPTPIKTPTKTPTPIKSPTPTPTGTTATMKLKLALQATPENGTNLPIRVTLVQNGTIKHQKSYNGTYKPASSLTAVTISNIAPGTYDIYIKGWAHLQRKISGVAVVNGTRDYDFTPSFMLAGDVTGDGAVPDENVNIMDIVYVVASYGESSVDIKADINRDGLVNGTDAAFVLQNYFLKGIII